MKKEFDLKNIVLAVLSLGLVIIIFQHLLIPIVLNIMKIFISLISLLKLLEMPYLFFGGVLILFILWHIFGAICNITIMLIKFIINTNLYKKQKKKEREI